MADSLAAQLKKFLVETNAIALAIGVVIGGAVTKLVGTIVSGFFMPLIGKVTPGGEWRAWEISIGPDNAIKAGEILGASIDFVIVSLVVFFMAVKIFRVEVKK